MIKLHSHSYPKTMLVFAITQGGVDMPSVESHDPEENNQDSAPEVSAADYSSVSAQECDPQENTTGSPMQNVAHPQDRLNQVTPLNTSAPILMHSSREAQLVSPVPISQAAPNTFQLASTEGVSTNPQENSNEHSQLVSPESILVNPQDHAQSSTVTTTLVDKDDCVSNII